MWKTVDYGEIIAAVLFADTFWRHKSRMLSPMSYKAVDGVGAGGRVGLLSNRAVWRVVRQWVGSCYDLLIVV